MEWVSPGLGFALWSFPTVPIRVQMGTAAPHPPLLSLHLTANIIKLIKLLLFSHGKQSSSCPFDFCIEHEKTNLNLRVAAYFIVLTSTRTVSRITKDIFRPHRTLKFSAG